MLHRTFLRAQKVQGGHAFSPGTVLNTLIQPSIVSADIDQAALQIKLSTALSRELNEEAEYVPPLTRTWVKAPVSELSTSVTRRDWFRLMSFNMMVDCWTPHSAGADTSTTTTPVQGVLPRIPRFTRAGSSDEEGFCNYDGAVDSAVPPFLTQDFRRQHLVNQIRHYDPDIVCLNEVNRTFFHGNLWKYIRYWGYGTLYQSSRGARVRALGKGRDPTARRNIGCIPECEDIGNVILFHKGRFFPLMMPGRDIGRHFHFVHFTGLRDKVTNMTVYVACVQLTAGESDEAASVRLHEMKQVLTVLDALVRNDSDRAHMTTVVCGDLNNVSDDEACVELVRERFFNTYDLVGGPRWTAWYYRDEVADHRYAKYLQKNVEEMQRSDMRSVAEAEVRRFARGTTTDHGSATRLRLIREEVRSPQYPWLVETRLRRVPVEPAVNSTASGNPDSLDKLALVKASMEERGIVCRTQDFIFYDPRSLALHQVLDVPDDSQIDPAQLFPSNKLPSHHLPLLVDVSFNDTFPDVGGMSLKP